MIIRYKKVNWDKKKLQQQARKFSKERFKENIEHFVKQKVKSLG